MKKKYNLLNTIQTKIDQILSASSSEEGNLFQALSYKILNSDLSFNLDFANSYLIPPDFSMCDIDLATKIYENNDKKFKYPYADPFPGSGCNYRFSGINIVLRENINIGWADVKFGKMVYALNHNERVKLNLVVEPQYLILDEEDNIHYINIAIYKTKLFSESKETVGCNKIAVILTDDLKDSNTNLLIRALSRDDWKIMFYQPSDLDYNKDKFEIIAEEIFEMINIFDELNLRPSLD